MPNAAYASPQVKMSTLHADLILQGIVDPDAQILTDAFIDENSSLFIDGMERLAHALSISREITNYGLPTSQPWERIWIELIGSPDIDAAYRNALSIYDQLLRGAIERAIVQRGNAHRAAQNQAHTKAPKHIKSYEILQLIQSRGHSIRLNLCRGVEDNGRTMTNGDYADIRREMRDLKVLGMDAVQDVITSTAYKNAYHPIQDYLRGLSFEGGDPIADLANYFHSEYGMFPVFLRRWLIGTCAKAMAAEQNRMLVMDGPKGIGKSHFVRWIASPMPAYFLEEELDTRNEDNKRRLAENWIWEVKELGSSMRKSDWESMKGFLTQRTVTFRRKYDRVDTIQPALASFIGTINNEEGFMPTGDRRYYVEKILSIDWAYTKIDVNQVWAQAMMLYLSGESWQPTTDQERQRIDIINEEYRILDPVEETIKKWFKIDPQNSNWWLSSLEIMDALKDPNKGNLRVGSELDMRKLARALTKLAYWWLSNARLFWN
jgi:hypothetical protein